MSSLSPLHIVAKGLDRYGAQVVIHDMARADRIVYSRHAVEGQAKFPPEALFIVFAPKIKDWRFLQEKGNFLVIGQGSPNLDDALGASSNAIVLSNRDLEPELLALIDNCCTAVDIWRRYSPRLLSAAISDNGLDEVLELASEMLGNPVAVLSREGTTIAHSNRVVTNDKLWDDLVYEGVNAFESEELSRTSSYSHDSLADSLTRPTIFNISPWKRRLLAGIWTKGTCNHVLVMLEDKQAIKESDFILADCISDVLSSTIGKVSNQRDSLAALFGELVSGEAVDDKALLRRSERLGVRLQDKNHLLMLVPRKQLEDPFIPALTLLGDLRGHFPNIPSFVFEQRACFIASAGMQAPGSARRVIEEFEKHHGELWQLSVSAPFSSLGGLAQARRQCLVALELGPSFLGERNVYHYENIAVQDFVNRARDRIDLTEYCLPQVIQMVERDKKDGTELSKTLYLYLGGYKNMVATSEELHVHRNTVAYRLERASELYGLNLEDAHVLDRIRLSFDLLVAWGLWAPTV